MGLDWAWHSDGMVWDGSSSAGLAGDWSGMPGLGGVGIRIPGWYKVSTLRRLVPLPTSIPRTVQQNPSQRTSFLSRWSPAHSLPSSYPSWSRRPPSPYRPARNKPKRLILITRAKRGRKGGSTSKLEQGIPRSVCPSSFACHGTSPEASLPLSPCEINRTGVSGWKRTAALHPSGTTSRSTRTRPTSK